MDPLTDALQRGLISPRVARRFADRPNGAPSQNEQQLGSGARKPVTLPEGASSYGERQQAAQVPTGSAIEDRPDSRGYMRKLAGFWLDDPLLNEIAQGTKEVFHAAMNDGNPGTQMVMPRLVTPLPNDEAGAKLGANDIASDYARLSPGDLKRFEAGKTPGSLDFSLKPGQLQIPMRNGTLATNEVPGQ
jgi:hypothetical protein